MTASACGGGSYHTCSEVPVPALNSHWPVIGAAARLSRKRPVIFFANKIAGIGSSGTNSGWSVLQVVHSGCSIAPLVGLAVHHSVIHAGVSIRPSPYGSRTCAEAGGSHPDFLAPLAA